MRALSLLAILMVGQAAWAVDMEAFERDYEEAKPWNEVQASLPGAPKEANMVRIDLGSATRNEYFVDKTSVTSGSDGVVRYTVVIVSAGGARTVNFEGMRCTTSEWKLYAFGRPDGAWARNRYASWAVIKDRATADYHRELFAHYFCTVDGNGDMKVIDHALRVGGIRRGESYNYDRR